METGGAADHGTVGKGEACACAGESDSSGSGIECDSGASIGAEEGQVVATVQFEFGSGGACFVILEEEDGGSWGGAELDSAIGVLKKNSGGAVGCGAIGEVIGSIDIAQNREVVGIGCLSLRGGNEESAEEGGVGRALKPREAGFGFHEGFCNSQATEIKGRYEG